MSESSEKPQATRRRAVESSGLSIAQAAERTGLSIDTLRYYERIGLLAPPARDSAGRRSYTDDDIGWLEFLTKLRTTGMPIRLMREYTRLCREGDGTAPRRRQILIDQRVAVRERIAELAACLEVLDYKIANYAAIEAALSGTDLDAREDSA